MHILGPPVAQFVKNLPAMRGTQFDSGDQEYPLEKGMTTHSSIPAWGIPWTEEAGKLQSVGSQRVGHDWATNTHMNVLVFTSLPCSLRPTNF